ncbi:MAG TPA: ABC transporter permease [Candidatus Acidoferrum sp.]|nr:ABC transporter permease [Candidatus Acidoferrum sp.]
MAFFGRILAITLKEFRQLSRDRLTFGMVVMIPLIQLLLFGYAINNNIRNINVGLVDQAQTSSARSIIAAVKATQVVNMVGYYDSVQEAEAAITAGKVRAVLLLPHDLDQRLTNRSNPQPLAQWLIDGSDNIVSSALLGLRNMPLQELQRNYAQQSIAPTFEAVLYFNPERRTPVNVVPGLLAVILTMTMILFTATAIVREKERGNLELLITTPLRSLELMLGKIIPFILIGLTQMTIILTLGHFVFDVPINGQPLNIVGATLLFISASLTLGLIISTIAQTQLQAMQMTVFVLLPSILLSGFLFPYEGMPLPAQYIAEVLPATHFVRMIRGVVLRDASLANMQPDTLYLLGFTVVGIIIATLKFKKSLD